MYKLIFYNVENEIIDMWFEIQYGKIISRLNNNETKYNFSRTSKVSIGNSIFFEYDNGAKAEIIKI